MLEPMILVLVGCIFGVSVGVLYRIGKLQESVNELKSRIER
jgi:hypothetical protein